jgi:hypothetical protein
VAPPCLSHWARRGQALPSDVDSGGATTLTEAELQCLVRCNEQDETNGFFVACLQRRVQLLSGANDALTVKPKIPAAAPDAAAAIIAVPVNIDLGIPLYQRGQLADAGPPPLLPTMPVTLPVVPGSQSKPNRKRKSTSPARSDEEVPRDARSKGGTAAVAGPTRHQSTEKTDSNETTPVDDRHGKKRAKAMEWKRRQHQARLARKQPK